jgi:Purine catabolism regulatory protein-like family/PucR C-terminal helix-turn-helix domain
MGGTHKISALIWEMRTVDEPLLCAIIRRYEGRSGVNLTRGRAVGGLRVSTLADLLTEPDLHLTCLVGEEQLDRTVRWAQPTEMVDPSRYLRGGELVCTVGSSLHDLDAIDRFVAAVAASGSAGVCFGLGDVFEEVPAALLRACRDHGLPLLTAAFGSPFRAIGEWVVEHRTERAAAWRHEEALTAELLAALRRHAPLAELLRTCAARVGGRFSTGPGPMDDGPGDWAQVEAATDGLTLHWTGVPPVPDAAFLQVLARLLAIAQHDRDVETDLRRERTGELLALVARRLAAPEALEEHLGAAGLTSGSLVFSVWPAGAVRPVAEALGDEPALHGETPTTAVVVTGSSDPLLRAARILGLPCGHSRAVPLRDAASALTEAQAAYDLSRQRQSPVGPDELVTLEGLLLQQPADRLAPFVGLLAPLLAADQDRGTRYLQTLRVFLDDDASLVSTARAEHLHVNTVRHRLGRISAITGQDPLTSAGRAALTIALWAFDHRAGPDVRAATGVRLRGPGRR